MYTIRFYKDAHGNQPVKEYILKLSQKNGKDNRINLNKIRDYIKALSEYGLELGEPYIKHLQDDLWELRPIRNRIFFVVWHNNEFILLHHFIKKTQKTPQREIDQAIKEINYLKEREDNNE